MAESAAEDTVFYDVCVLLEKLRSKSGRDKSKSKRNKGGMDTLISEFFGKYRGKWKSDGESLYPILRLMRPDLDGARVYGLKEAKLAEQMIKHFGIGKDSTDAQRLIHWKEAALNKGMSGDFQTVMVDVLQGYAQTTTPKLSVAELNCQLDSLHRASGLKGTDGAQLRDSVFRVLAQKMTGLEIKWFASLILKKHQSIGGEKFFFSAVHPQAYERWNKCSDLKKVCEELRDPNIALETTTCVVFDFVRPMMGQRLTDMTIKKMLETSCDETGRVFVETKYDGVRIQMHKQGDQYRYFTRAPKEVTSDMGSLSDDKGPQFTRLLHECFKESVRDVIIDGEMMSWSPEAEAPVFGIHVSDVMPNARKFRNIGSDEIHPCFIVFDVISLNGKDTIGMPLRERRQLLKQIVIEKSGILSLSRLQEARSEADLVALMNEHIDTGEEGIVVKSPLSRYVPGGRLNDGWYKIKAEHIDNFQRELDLLVVGGFPTESSRRGGQLTHFLLAVRGHDSADGKPHFHTFCKVGSGLLWREVRELNESFKSHWVRTVPDWLSVEGGKSELPKLFIEPQNSVVLQIKAGSVMQTKKFSTAVTVRFPRAIKVRTDKSWRDCMTLADVEELRRVGLINQDRERGSFTTKGKRPRRETQLRRKTDVFNRKLDVSGVQRESELFVNKVFYPIHWERPDLYPSIEEHCNGGGVNDDDDSDDEGARKKITPDVGQRLIAQHGGTVVVNQMKSTTHAISARMSQKVRQVAEKLGCVYRLSYLIDCVRAGIMVPVRPEHILYCTEEFRQLHFTQSYDKYDDSYTEPVTGRALRECVLRMNGGVVAAATAAIAAATTSSSSPTSSTLAFPPSSFSIGSLNSLTSFSEPGSTTTTITPSSSSTAAAPKTLAFDANPRVQTPPPDTLSSVHDYAEDNCHNETILEIDERASQNIFALRTIATFRQCHCYFDMYAIVGDTTSRLPDSPLFVKMCKFQTRGGCVCDTFVRGVTTHVVMDPADLSRLDIFRSQAGLPSTFLVTMDWIDKSIDNCDAVSPVGLSPLQRFQ